MKVPPFFAGPAPTNRSQLTEPGAHLLAVRIMEVWHKAGHGDVWAKAEPVAGAHTGHQVWCVKTNLVGGLPPR